MRRKVFITYVLFTAVILLLAAALFFALGGDPQEPDSQDPEPPDRTKAELSINNFRHTATRDGKTEWELQAGSAGFFSNRNQVRLKDVSLTFAPRQGRPETHLTAEKGRLNLQSNNMTASGRVVVENPDYRLETETLHYASEQNIIFTKMPVNIVGASIQLRADWMKLHLKNGKLQCRGNVEGTLIGAEFSEQHD
ncbi:MAG: LPS export ABC transporter periplasmic protein LptC [Desulfosalsimonadaceae bacterium]